MFCNFMIQFIFDTEIPLVVLYIHLAKKKIKFYFEELISLLKQTSTDQINVNNALK